MYYLIYIPLYVLSPASVTGIVPAERPRFVLPVPGVWLPA